MSKRVLSEALGPELEDANAMSEDDKTAATVVTDLRTPCLVVRESVLQRNAKVMINRAAALGCSLRPHFKTIKTIEGAMIATGGTKRRLVCSTLSEVAFLASHGFDDLIYAVPLTSNKVTVCLQPRTDNLGS